MSKRKELLKAHHEFELARLKGGALREGLKQELDEFFSWLKEQHLNEVLTEEQVSQWFNRNVIDFQLSGEIESLITDSAERIRGHLEADSTPFKEIIPEKDYKKLVVAVSKMEKFRNTFIHHAVRSSLYSKLISHILYNGIKAFTLSEKGFFGKIPAASSILKMGRDFINKAAPSLEETVDNKLIEFLGTYIKDSVQRSEDFLQESLNEKIIKELADEIWKQLEDRTVGEFSVHADPEAVSLIAPVALDVWHNYRKTPFFHELSGEIIHFFFERYGTMTIGKILKDLKVETAQVAEEIEHFVLPLFQGKKFREYLSARIEVRLKAFYDSKEAKEVLGE